MVETFTIATFSGRVGETFCVHLSPDETVDAQLVEVTALGGASASGATTRGKRVPFSLVFQSPPQIRLVQRIYKLAHPSLGVFEIFLVPIGLDERGLRCEAIFT